MNGRQVIDKIIRHKAADKRIYMDIDGVKRMVFDIVPDRSGGIILRSCEDEEAGYKPVVPSFVGVKLHERYALYRDKIDKTILWHVKNGGKATKKHIAQLLQVTPGTAQRHLTRMKREGKL